MTLSIQVVDGLLNTSWLLLALVAWLAARHHGQNDCRWRGFLALICAAVLILPVISISDDLAEQGQVYDATASLLSVKSGKELKQFAVVPGTPAVADSSAILVSNLSFLQYIPFVPTIALTALTGSMTGIHSPPVVL